ncbi:MAG: LysR family transcriptional regulator [Pseudomonadota bacterium]
MKKGIDLRDIALLARLAETGSLASAARALDIPASVASRRLAALEHAVGQRLAERTTRSTKVTAEGLSLAKAARRILDDWDGAVGVLAPEKGALAGTLKISAPHMFGRAVLAPALSAFTRRHPLVHLDIRFSDVRLDLDAEDLDIVVRIAQPVGNEGAVHELSKNRKVVVASPEYIERAGAPTHPSDLRNHDCLVPAGRADWAFEQDGRRETVTVSGPIIVNDGAFIRDAAVHGVGFALKSWFDVADLVRQGALKTVLDDFRASPDQGVWAILRHGREDAPEALAFLDFLQEAMTVARQ